MIWTAANGHETCRGCDHRFTRDEPMALLTSRRLKRCAPCVNPTVPDWDAIHAVIEARAIQRSGEPSPIVPQTFERVVPGSLTATLKAYGIRGVRRVNPAPPKPYSEVADYPDVVREREQAE